ncbi:hypothetical protein [Candidatus Accumulibacter contiguus]|uniref:hypothetical protein n=1 Tax=Candidatus Accumulibacter contiguus TaxID=2954381 RepID=UPI002FC2EE72
MTKKPPNAIAISDRTQVEFVLEIAIAKAVDGELPGKQGFEESDILRRDRVEGGDMLTGFAL